MFDFENDVLTDIEKTYAMIKQNGNQLERCALEAVDLIKEYIINHKPSYKDYETFLVYIKKSDKLWKQKFNNYMKNYKYINNKIVRVT